MIESYPFYVAGKAVHQDEKLEVLCKARGEVVAEVSLATGEDLLDALTAGAAQAAKAALPAWRRQEILSKLSRAIAERREDFAQALCLEAGKPIRDARVEVDRAVETFRVAGEEAVRMSGEWMPLEYSSASEGMQGLIRRFPAGLCALITPFNFPLNLAAHKIGPAIAVGNPFILKPASSTPITALMLGEVLATLDLPEGMFSILPLKRLEAERLASDARVKRLSFTGSPEVGWKLKANSGRAKVSLELGGNAACVVDADTNLDFAADRITTGAFYQSGQSCISVQRVFAHADIYDDLRERLVSKARGLKAGEPMEEDTFLGPLITENDAERVKSWIDEAVDGGATLLCGGERKGPWVNATWLEKVRSELSLSCREVFGPVAILESYTDFKSVIERVNDSDFGLQVGVFTKNLDRAHYAFEHCEVGGVIIGDIPSLRVDAMPYGGVKDSGEGREGLRFAMEEMSDTRIMLMRGVGRL